MRSRMLLLCVVAIVVLAMGSTASGEKLGSIPYGNMVNHCMMGGMMPGMGMMGGMMPGMGMMGQGQMMSGMGRMQHMGQEKGGRMSGQTPPLMFPSPEMIEKMRQIHQIHAEMFVALAQPEVDLDKVRELFQKSLTFKNEMALMQFDRMAQVLKKSPSEQ